MKILPDDFTCNKPARDKFNAAWQSSTASSHIFSVLYLWGQYIIIKESSEATLSHISWVLLKACVHYFLSIFFSPNDNPLKTMKNVFYFIWKALFLLEIFKFLCFFPFLSTPSRFKRANGSHIIYDVTKWLT